MTEIKIDNTVIQLYSSIKELPIELSKKFNNYLLQDAGIGNTIADIDDHLQRLMMFVNADKKAETIEELKNMRFNLFSTLSNFHYKSLAFGCLVKTIDGKRVEDYSAESINSMISRLSDIGLTEGHVQETINEVKKNWIRSAISTSPSSLETI